MGWRRARVPAAAVLAGILSACTGATDDGGEAAPTAAASPTVEIGDTRYFDGSSFVGQPVTVAGRITRVITPTSFVLDARELGDDSLLVLTGPRDGLTVGALVEVEGRVEVFTHPTYVDEFALASADRYEDFAGEEFVAAAQPNVSPAPDGD